MSKSLKKIISAIGILLVGITAGLLLNKPICLLMSDKSEPAQEQYKISHQRGFIFINPLLDFEQKYREIPKARMQIDEYIAKSKKQGHLKDISVYFRHLNTGMTFTINENIKFSPASLLKVPLMIACLKQAEADPEFLIRKVKFDFPDDGHTVPNFRYGDPIVRGQTYTMEDLIVRLILNSDNNAGTLLIQNVDNRILERVYADLEVAMPWFNNMENYMTVSEYSKFMRILYNSTYLSREMSEFALYIMSLSSFDNGIKAGIETGTTVAHKFGERDIEGIKQLHDCGIIYYDSGPCLLCVMTRGDNFAELETVIADITKIITAEMASEK